MSVRSMRWLAYARWQLLDAAWQRVLLPLVLASLLVFFGFYSVKGTIRSPADWLTPDAIRFSGMMLKQAMSMFIPLAVLMGVNGLLAQDRQKGFFRFYFSKPVPVPAFYISAFVSGGLLVVGTAALIAAVIGAYGAPQPVLGVALACALTFALLGSIAFLLSSITVHDGIVFILVWVATLLIRDVEPSLRAGHWVHTAVRVLPPTQRLDALREALYSGQVWQAADAWHVLAYGGACFVLGLIAVRKLPLAR